MQHLLFLIINFLLFFVVLSTGYVIQKKKKLSFRHYTPLVIIYTIVLGARYKRGDDYEHYQEIYNKGMEYEQILFTWFNDSLHFLCFSDTGIFFVYAFVFIMCAYPLLKYYRETGKWLLPCFFVAFLLMEEVLVRQALAYSFLFVFLWGLFNNKLNSFKKLVICIFTAFIAIGIHTATLLPIAIIVVGFYLFRTPFNYKVTIPVYLFVSLYFQYNISFGRLNELFFLISGFNHFDVYVQEGSSWLSEEGINEAFARNIILKPFEVIGSCSYLFFASKFLHRSIDVKQYSINVLFNMSFLGMLVYQGFFLMEIPRRSGEMIYVFWFVPMAYILTRCKFKKEKLISKCLLLSMTFFAYPYLKYLFFNDSHVPYLFLWDK